MTFSGLDAESRAWRKEQAEISNDIAGLPRDRHADAMIAALDVLDLSDDQRILAMTAYFISLSMAQSDPARNEANPDPSAIVR